MNPGIVICTRSNSRRVPSKPLQLVGNPPKTLIRLLAENLQEIGIPFVFAMPQNEFLKDLDIELAKYKTYFGSNDNVLARFYGAARLNDFDPIIRVTHDDILIDGKVLKAQLDKHARCKWDYSYPVNVIDGTGAEIVNMSVLEEVIKHYPENQSIEHLSYVFKRFAKSIHGFDAKKEGLR